MPNIYCSHYREIVDSLLKGESVSTQWTNEPNWALKYADFASYYLPMDRWKYCDVWAVIKFVETETGSYIDFSVAIKNTGFYGTKVYIDKNLFTPEFYKHCWYNTIELCIHKHEEAHKPHWAKSFLEGT